MAVSYCASQAICEFRPVEPETHDERIALTSPQPNRLCEALTIIAFLLFVVSELLFRQSMFAVTYPAIVGNDALSIAECASMALAITAIALRKQSLALWQIGLSAITLSILSLSAYFTNDFRLLQGFILLIALSTIDLKKACGVYGVTVTLVFIIVVLASVCDLISNRDVMTNSHLVFSYGFTHPNGAGACLLSAIGALAFYSWDKRAWILSLVIATFSALFSYFFLSSHTAAIALTMIAAAIAVGHLHFTQPPAMLRGRYAIAALILIFLALSLLMLFCTIYYDPNNDILSWLNSLIHGRPQYAHEYYLSNEGITLFGKKYYVPAHYHNGIPFCGVDSGYCRFFLSYGIFSFIAFGLVFAIATYRLFRHRFDFFIFVSLLVGLLHLVLECHQLYLPTSYFLLFLSAAFSSRNYQDRTIEHKPKRPSQSSKH